MFFKKLIIILSICAPFCHNAAATGQQEENNSEKTTGSTSVLFNIEYPSDEIEKNFNDAEFTAIIATQYINENEIVRSDANPTFYCNFL
jgi:hypothetical protein